MKRAAHRTAFSNNYLGKVLLIDFAITWINLLEHCISDEYLLMKDYVWALYEKSCLLFLFAEHFKSNYFGKVSLITFVYASNKMLKHCIFNDSLLIVNYMQGLLRK